MLKILTLIFLSLASLSFLAAQNATLTGTLLDDTEQPVVFANVILYEQADSTVAKVETTDENGGFTMSVPGGNYYLRATYVGLPDLYRNVSLAAGEAKNIGNLSMGSMAVELETATVTATRTLVEVKPDRTVFNVQGTINAVGNDGLELLRKAPGVTLDNNDNITVLSRSGVLVYVDGKRLPLAGAELTNYLRSLTAEQIDRIDIITNPGARYEAEGNAGIIDIRLKKNENEGLNGTASTSVSKGRRWQHNQSATLNYRNRRLNAFGTLAHNRNDGWNRMAFNSFQNGLRLDETSNIERQLATPSGRFGMDFFLGDKTTVGFLVSAQRTGVDELGSSRIDIYDQEQSGESLDSLLRSDYTRIGSNEQQTYNLNYRYEATKNSSLTVDLDYGRFRNERFNDQPNLYFQPGDEDPSSSVIVAFDTPVDIDIYTAKADWEQPLLDGQFGGGVKYSRVQTDNTFLFFDVIDGDDVQNDTRSNRFLYDENVYAGYVSFGSKFNEKWSYQLGLRAEVTDATGNLRAFRDDLQEPPVELDYVNWFPNAGLTYQLDKPGNSLALAYGRRINRPDYNVLNPFREQINELSYSRGNPFLSPEIVNNLELGYTVGYRYNFKLSYSRTENQITRLIGPDEEDPRAGFISWDNLATQSIYNLNISAPLTINEKWSLYVNASGGYLDNQATYDNGATIDVQAWTYNIFAQNTFNLPWKLTAEVGGWFSGPGVWGGVFRYNETGSLNLGLQRKFLNDQLNVKLTANDIFFTTGWNGFSEFNELKSFGNGNWDSRRVGVNLSYSFGNQKVKSRKRKTGLEDEAKRAGS